MLRSRRPALQPDNMDDEEIVWEFDDLFSLDLRARANLLIESLPPKSSYPSAIRHAASATALLAILPRLLAESPLTMLVEMHFRPILMDLCAKWLDYPEDKYKKLAAFGVLIELHEELYP